MKRKIPALIAAALFSACLMIPTQALAAPPTTLTIDGTDYTAGASANGPGWQWDCGSNLTLDVTGDSAITTVSEAAIQSYPVGDLTINVADGRTLSISNGSLALSSISAINSFGNLTIGGNGTISVSIIGSSTAYDVTGIRARGDISITGTTVTIDLVNNAVAASANDPWVYGVYCSRDINVSAAHLTSNVRIANSMPNANTGCYPIFSTAQSIHITNGSAVDANARGSAKYQNGIYAADSLVISDSTVTVDAGSNVGSGYNGTGGICASVTNSTIGPVPATLSITNSNVTARGDRAMTSWASEEGHEPDAVSTLTLTSCHFTEPAGAVAQNISVSEQVSGAPDQYMKGLVVGTGSEEITSWSSPDIARSVTIVPDALPTPVIPTTGDDVRALVLGACALLSGLIICGVAFAVNRRRRMQIG